MNGPALAVPDKVAGQAAEGQKAPAEVDGGADGEQHESDDHDGFADVVNHDFIPFRGILVFNQMVLSRVRRFEAAQVRRDGEGISVVLFIPCRRKRASAAAKRYVKNADKREATGSASRCRVL